jgi:UDPglucose 6-dehydrogenase
MMRVAMIGSGYVGLVSGACFADFGHIVTCVDKDPARIARLLKGEIPIFEPGLDDLVAANVREKRLLFTTDIRAAVADAEAVFIAVGTPPRNGDGHADLTYVYAAAREIADALAPGAFTVVVTKSTVPVGTGDEIERIIREARPDVAFAVASNPEFLREGAAIDDFKRPDRIVIGLDDPRAKEAMEELYRPLDLNQQPIVFTSRRTSELIKYAANAFLATKITFINEMADLCEKVGADVQDVARGIGLDNRIGAKFLRPGPGYGGSCFPKDTMALIRIGQEAGAPVRIVESVAASNEARKRRMAEKVLDACDGSVTGKTIAVLGLAFKPDTDDMRDAASLTIIPILQSLGARERAFDPEAMAQARPLLPQTEFCNDPYSCLEGADALVILTEWDAFRALDLERVKSLLASQVVVDMRNIYRPAEMRRRGFRYVSVGRN